MKATHNPPTDLQVTLADRLRMAALYLRQHGWTQGAYYATTEDNPFPPACAIGAIGMAAHGVVTDCPEIEGPHVRDCNKAVEYLGNHLHDHGHINLDSGDWNDSRDPSLPYSTGDWNDRPGRTAEQVTTALDAAADEWDRLHTQGGDQR